MAKKIAKDTQNNKGADTFDLASPPALVVTPDKPVVPGGNFEAMKNYLTVVRDSYKDMVFSTSNMDQVTKTKATMRSMRTSLEKIEKDVKAEWFNNPKQVFSSAMGVLYSLIGEVESKCDAVIAEEDEKRIDGINQVINVYAAEAGFAGLRDEYQEKFVRAKAWYNKTAVELDIKNAVEVQVSSLLKEQKAYDANVRLIDKACEKEPRLSRRVLLSMLDRGDDIASILEFVEEEISRLDDVKAAIGEEVPEDKTPENYPVEESLEDEASELDFSSDLPSRTKKVVVEITYPADAGEAMTQLFALLHKRGIKSKVVG